MAQKFNYEQMADDIVRLVGGKENIQSLGHCMTRLRFILKDDKKADAESIKAVGGVLGVVNAGGQFMVILGQNLLPVYDAAIKRHGLNAGAAIDENLDDPKIKEPLTLKSAGLAALSYVSTSVTALLPGLVAGGMLKVVLLLITLVSDTFSSTATYSILSGVADAPFYFMPIFIAYGAAVKLGGTPIYAMAAAAALLHGNWTGLVGAGDPVTLLGLPVRLVSYSSSLLPALLIALLAYYLEKGFNKVIPGIFKSLLVGLCTITVTSIAAFLVLAPLGSFVGQYLALVFVFLGDKIGFIAMGALAACLPWLVMCGMHTALVPFMTQSLVDPGYDSLFRPAFILHNMAEGGSCIGVALKSKNAAFRSEALGIAFGCIVAGVTEPAIYGINLPKKKPMIGVMAGGAAGGVVAALLGARVFVMGYSTILALPIFQQTILAALAGVIVAIVVAAIVSFILCPADEDSKTAARSGVQKASAQKNQKNAAADAPSFQIPADALAAPADGEMIDITTVSDETFASKMLGDGVAFRLADDAVAAPCDGDLTVVMDTGHAFAVTRPDGVELLIHIGINTVEMQGKGFTILAKAGEKVKAGQPIIRVDRAFLEGKGYDTTTMLIVSNANGKEISFKPYGAVVRGAVISA